MPSPRCRRGAVWDIQPLNEGHAAIPIATRPMRRRGGVSQTELEPILADFHRESSHMLDDDDEASILSHSEALLMTYSDDDPTPPSTVRCRRSAVADLSILFNDEGAPLDESAILVAFGAFGGFVRRDSSRHSQRRYALSGVDLADARRWSEHSDDTK